MLIHHDFERMFNYLSDEECGILIKAALRYDIHGEDTQFEDRALMLSFDRLKDLLDRNREKYEDTCRKRTEAAQKRWEEVKQERANLCN